MLGILALFFISLEFGLIHNILIVIIFFKFNNQFYI